MPQAETARSQSIIDLTGDDEDGQLDTLHVAASKAQAAASRLSSQFKSLTAAANRNPFEHRKNVASKETTIGKEAGVAGKTLYRSDEVDRPPPHQSLSSENKVKTPSKGPREGSFKAQVSFLDNKDIRRAGGSDIEPPRKSKDVQHFGASNGRSPRAAAHAAERIIANTYNILNPLEEQQEANSRTPRKPGRPKIDQWTPNHKKTKVPNHDKRGGIDSVVPVSQDLDTESSGEDYDSSGSLASVKPALTSEHKRKREDSSSDSASTSKQARLPIANSKLDYGRNNPFQEASSLLPAGAVLFKKLSREPDSEGNFGPTPGPLIDTAASISEKLSQQIAQTTLRPKHSMEMAETGDTGIGGDPTPIQDSTNFVALSKIFRLVIYPALKKAKTRHHDQLAEDDLVSISRTVATEIVDEKLKDLPLANLMHPTHDQRKEIKRFVKGSYSRKVLSFPKSSPKDSNSLIKEQLRRREWDHESASTETSLEGGLPSPSLQRVGASSTSRPSSSRVLAASPRGQPVKITDLGEYLKKLEGETSPAELSVFEDPSPVRPSAFVTEDQVIQKKSHRSSPAVRTTSADRVVHKSLGDHRCFVSSPPVTLAVVEKQAGLDSNTEPNFPPDFDRGRYPYLRRRRGNKFYTPERPQKPITETQAKPMIAKADQRLAQVQGSDDRSDSSNSATKQERSNVPISQILVHRVTTDLKIKTLCRAVASGEASSAQIKAFQELTAESGQPRSFDLSLGVGSESGSRDQTTDLERESDGSQSEDSLDLSTDEGHADSAPTSEMEDDQYARDSAKILDGASLPHKFQVYGKNDEGGKHPLPPRPQLLEARSHMRQPFTSQKSGGNIHSKQPQLGIRLRQITSSMPRSPLDQIPQTPVVRKLETAYDPNLEHTVAVLMTGDHENSLNGNKALRYVITPADQELLLHQQTIFKYADLVPEEYEDRGSKVKERRLTMIESRVVDPSRRPERHIPRLLRNRMLGTDSRNRNVNTQIELRQRVAERLESWRSWKGASGDIVAAAWGSDSTTFAVGAAAHTNPEDVQYNRPCNLLLGDLIVNTLTELPDHRVPRPKPELLGDTYNARQAVYEACDSMIYETVSSIGFSSSTDRMYTASHDRTVKIWDTSAKEKKCIQSFVHNAKVTSVEVSSHLHGVFATASDVIEDSIRVYYTNPDESNYAHVSFSSSRAQLKQKWRIYPECLRWGPTVDTCHLLLAGFRQWEHGNDEVAREGQLCLWDVNASKAIKVIPSSQGILAAAWHPTLPFFATGGAPGSTVTDRYITKTVVRTWDLRSPKHYSMEYECSALDMQDITFSPLDSHIVTAGCTDGSSFVWDYRSPNKPLHRLRHGNPLVDWDHTRGRREEVDTGVMMSLWGVGGSLFYTGSSDGRVKAWDVRRHPQDVLIRNVAQLGAGIQSGAFSPDGTNLLVGDADGGVHVLTSAACGPRPIDDISDKISPELPITLIRAPNGSTLTINPDLEDPGTEGRDAAKYLTDSMQLNYDTELGVTQGYMYEGPYANDWKQQAHDPKVRALSRKQSAADKQSFLRSPEENKEVEESRRGLIRARKRRIQELYDPVEAAQEPKAKKIHTDNAHTDPKNPRDNPPLSQSEIKARKNDELFENAREAARRAAEEFEESQWNVIPESEMVEENYWWPHLGALEIERARAGQGHLNFPE